MYRKLFSTVVALAGVTAVAAGLAGCGSAKPSLTYNASPTAPVVVYTSTSAIAPVYNPLAPVVIIYGDGTKVTKEDSYKFTQGKLTGEVPAVLDKLAADGFFGLGKDYTSAEQPGGAVQTITVTLSDRTKQVAAAGGSAPPQWQSMVKALTDAPTVSSSAYVPSTIVLYASPDEGGPGSGATVLPWPAGAGDLSAATATSGTQLKGEQLTGEQAKAAWLAIAEQFPQGQGDTVWSYNGKLYTYVYAAPVFPGVQQSK